MCIAPANAMAEPALQGNCFQEGSNFLYLGLPTAILVGQSTLIGNSVAFFVEKARFPIGLINLLLDTGGLGLSLAMTDWNPCSPRMLIPELLVTMTYLPWIAFSLFTLLRTKYPREASLIGIWSGAAFFLGSWAAILSATVAGNSFEDNLILSLPTMISSLLLFTMSLISRSTMPPKHAKGVSVAPWFAVDKTREAFQGGLVLQGVF
jgi:hypothetical protein